ncbi:PKD domain-containing protein [Ancylomarina sp. YFZ004]
MNRSQTTIIKSLPKLISFVLLFINAYALQAQKPACNFNDTNGYFYHWDFSAENLEFDFVLENLTDETITDNISEYKINWGDGSNINGVKNKKFPLKHTYDTQDQFDLVITIIYLGEEYSYDYIVYNTVPDAEIEKIEGDNGCLGQKFIFKLKNYENNPRSTTYRWTFGDDTIPIIWNYDSIIDNSAIMSHVYKNTSCDFEGDEDHFATTVSPRIRIDRNNLKGFGVSVNDITISKNINLNIEFFKDEERKIITDNHTGCSNNTIFKFQNNSNYGLDDAFCEATNNHEWTVTKYEDGIEVGNGELGTDYYFVSGSADSKGNISIKFLKTGAYKITFYLANACSTSVETTGEISIYENENTTTYTPHNFCLADEEIVSLTTTEVPEIEAIQKTTYLWTSTLGAYEFVDGTSSISQNPKIKFNKAGKHTVHLQKESLCGTEEYEYVVEVSDKPVVLINTPTEIINGGHCGAFTFTPSATYTDNGKVSFGIVSNEMVEYLWTFDNNGIISSSSLRDPDPVTFSKIGASSIRFKARNSQCGWSDVHQIEFNIFAIPEISFTRLDPSCEDEEIVYNAFPEAMKTYTWLFGNGNTVNGQNATNTFMTAGAFTDRLTVVSNDGCTNSVEKRTTIIAKPTVNAGANMSICNNDTSFEITDASLEDYLSFTWTSTGDGTFSDDKNLSPTYNLGAEDHAKSTIELTLTAEGNGTCGEEIDHKTIYITPAPIISFDKTTDKICQYSTCDIEGVVVDNAKSLEWTASEAGSFSNKTSTHTSFTPTSEFSGTITLTLTAYGKGNCPVAQKTFKLEVVKQPTVDAKDNARICEGEEVNLSGTSSSSINKWDSSGDGVFSDENSLNGTYIPGIKDIEYGAVILGLNALGDAPCKAHDIKRVYISKKPNVNAGADASMCKTVTNYMIQTGSAPDMAQASNYLNLLWSSSGTGSFTYPTALNATYTPSEKDLTDGKVELSIEAKPEGSCLEAVTDKMTLTFTDPPEVDAGVDITNCQGSITNLNGAAQYTSSILWTSNGEGNFDDATKLDAKYIADPNETGIITLSLTAQPIGACSAISDNLELTLIAKPVANAGVDNEICADGSYNLTDGSNRASVYSAQSVSWLSLGDGSFDTPNSLNAIYTPGVEDITNGSVILQLTANSNKHCADPHSDEMTLTITPLAIAYAGKDETICQGGLYEVTTATAENSSRLEWKTSSPDGYFENGETLTPIYHPGSVDMGETTLSLFVYGKGFCSSVQDDMILNMTPAPVVSLLDKADICEDGIYLATETVIDFTPGYVWSTTGLGTITNGDGLKPTYTAKIGEIGDINFCLSVEGNGLCDDKTACTNITIVPHPTVEAGDDGEVCTNQVYQMNIGDEAGQLMANSWSTIEYATSGDGFFKSEEGLNANYILGDNDKLAGQVKITIKANSINPCNEFAEDDMMLTITPAPIVKAGANDEVCQGQAYTLLSAQEENTSSLLWKTNDEGSFSDETILYPIYTPADGKTGIVKLELIGSGQGSCSSSSDVISLNIIPIPHVSTGDDASICFGKNYDLIATEATSFSTILWTSSGTGSFNDDSKLKAIYIPSEEDYILGSVLLKISVGGLNPCTLSAEDEMLLSFTPAPTVNAGENAQICQKTGSYTIKQKSTAYPLGSQADNYSSIIWETTGKGSIQNSNTIEPTYIANPDETGIIHLSLRANGNSNCDLIEDEMLLTIVPTPVADFTTGNSCVGNPVQFEDLSTAGIYNITSWLWTFEGGTTSELQNPIHQFSEAKDYKISLVVTNSEGCTELIEKMIPMNPLPEMDFTHESIAAIHIPVEFKNNSLNAISYSWDFGDGNTSTNFAPKHTYTNKGFYTIELTAKSKDGCFNTLTSEIEVIGKPEARFSKTADGCGPLSIEFTNLSTGKFMNYLWDFGNGTQSTEAKPNPVIYEQGVLSDTTYFVSLTLENKAGISIFKDKVIVKPHPIPLFEILPSAYGCSPVVRELFNHSTGLSTDYEFDFGDGTTYTYKAKKVERPFEHTYVTGEEKTIYPITLRATNECGSRSITKNMTVYPNTAVAVMKVEDAEGCAPFTVEFQNLSTGTGDYLESDWIFEDGEMTVRDYEGKTVYHTFEKAGIYQVQLSVHDTCATDLTTREIIVNDAIAIDFEMKARKFCMFEEVQLSIPENIINQFTNFTWNFGDGTIIEGSNISHRFNKAGNYLIKLSAISKENSCPKTQTKELVIHQKPIADYSLSSNEGCEPFQVSFINKSSFTDYYQWDFNDSSKSSAKNPRHNFSQGNYTVSLITESNEGCLDTLSADILSRPKPIAQFEMDINRSCIIPVSLKVQNTSTDKEFNGYVWDFDNGTIQTDKQAIEETFVSEGKYNIKLIAENQFHCTDTFTQELNVYKAPVPKYKTVSKTSCQDELIEFADMSTDSKYCYWTFSDGASCEGKNASHIFKDYGRYDLTLKVVGDGNCADSLFAKNAIFVYPKPDVNFTWENINTPPDGIDIPEGISPPNNGLIQFTNLTEVVNKDWIKDNKYTYHWDFDDFQLCQEIDPLHKYENNGTFHVKLTALSAYSCQNIISEPVEVDLMSSLFVPNAFNPGNPNPQVALFLPKGIGLYSYDIEILDHWGKVVWFSNQIKDGRPAEGWDGTLEGKSLPQGIYIWKIRAVFKNGATWQGMKIHGKYHREGSITLIK